ncbi:MAG: D-alanine--poly(phosphoribitol) ligase subunit DltC [Bacillota bacterium]
MNFKEKVLQVIAEVCEDDVVKEEYDLDIFDAGLIDSFATVELLVQFEEQLDINVPITEFDRDTWNTPNAIVDRLNELK